ncbi:hypothetical protein Lepto7376_4391 [[Leptolyngbya] sp. PCC 7376]|uniref:hypothetical protein n=1 Tax=[Leptolyngbya] sp. PCC 7376 TaxID=111781 RepID=UPI00029ECC94|nr:hypothetical protein [[Leptolyngbya] sp. PCC 7376]AFY40499.1 hypothetical protein Lepto7376_4391 [[Leptolyngbya] sp. PCC 7376]
MSTELVPDFEIDTAQQLAEYLAQAETWSEIERLTEAFKALKVEAWGLLSEEQQQHILKIKQWKDHEIAQIFPLGSTVQRRDDPEKKQGVVTDYWTAYDIDYVTFTVNGFTDWCQGKHLKRIYSTT